MSTRGQLELITKNAELLRDLHKLVTSASKKRDESPGRKAAWQDLCRNFHDSYDRLAFPGGLANGLRGLAAHEPGRIESAIAFLEADPFFFRSGYIKEQILEHLRWAPLDNNQKGRLREVVVARVQELETGVPQILSAGSLHNRYRVRK